MLILSARQASASTLIPCGRGLAVALVSDYPTREWRADVLDRLEQSQLTNWLDDLLPRAGVTV
jgi:hypothetical protein